MANVATRVLFLVSSGLLVACEGLEGRAYAAYMQSTVRGRMALQPAGGGNLDANKVDVETDLGLDDESPSPYVRGEITGVFGRVTLSGFGYDESGNGQIPAGKSFGVIAGPADVQTDLRVINVKGSWAFDLEFGPLRLSPGLALDVFDVKTEARSVSPVSAFEEVSVFAPVPMLSLQSELDLTYVALNLDAAGMVIDLPDADGAYLDLEGTVRFRPTDRLEVFGGYRYISIDADGETDGQPFDTDLRIDGWFLGGGIVF